MVRFGEKKILKEKFMLQKSLKKVWMLMLADNIVISKLIETKTNSEYLIGIIFDKAIRP